MRKKNIRIPATKRELEPFDLTDIEVESFLKDGTTLEAAVRTTRESRLLARLKTDYPCGKCLKPLGERQGGFTWDRDILTWVHIACPRRRRKKAAR